MKNGKKNNTFVDRVQATPTCQSSKWHRKVRLDATYPTAPQLGLWRQPFGWKIQKSAETGGCPLTYLWPRKFLRNQILLDYLGRWHNQSSQIFFRSVHSGVFGKGSNFAIFRANRRWPLQLLYYRTTVINTIITVNLWINCVLLHIISIKDKVSWYASNCNLCSLSKLNASHMTV